MAHVVANFFDDPAGPPATPPKPIRPARVHGGSKWAHLFSGRARPEAAETETVLHLNALCLPDGTISEVTDAEDSGGIFADTAFPLQAGATVTLGQFLSGALPGIMAQRRRWANGRVACVAPAPPQRDVLRRLGLLDGYVALGQAVRFRLAVGQAGTPPRPSAANQTLLNLFDMLRAPAAGTAKKPLAILPNREREIFGLRNRASLTAWLRARRIALLDPEKLSFDAVAAALAAASVLILVDITQAGLIGLCGADTHVVQVAPEGYADRQARELCAAMGIEWSLVLGTAPSYPLTQSLAFGARVPLAYEVPINALHAALGALAG